MSSLFKKPLEDITISDVQQIVDEGYPEGTSVEFKRALPSKKPDGDPWLQGGSEISDYARNQLLEELVAFANGQGGYLVIGVEETDEKPARAKRLTPLPRCAELAEKVRLQARDCISPKLPLIHSHGLELSEDGSGVVIVYVPQSRLAPHRLEQTAHCYIRRNDRSEKMTMREIQELTLRHDRGISELNEKFSKRHFQFWDLMRSFFLGSNGSAIRATLLPIFADIWIDKVHKNDSLKPVQKVFSAHHGKYPVSLHSLMHFSTNRSRPILRGTRYEGGELSSKTLQEIYCDGTVEYLFLARDKEVDAGEGKIYPEWILSFVINAMLTAHQFRALAGSPDMEYGLEVEIARLNGKLKLNKYSSGSNAFEIEVNPLIFPRFSIGGLHEFQEVIKILHRDMWNSAGVDVDLDFEIELPDEFAHE